MGSGIMPGSASGIVPSPRMIAFAHGSVVLNVLDHFTWAGSLESLRMLMHLMEPTAHCGHTCSSSAGYNTLP